MSEGNESFLRFSLEESVWFQKGQEVADLLNISLDPNIIISEKDGYINIDGALELTGEYKREQGQDLPETDFPTSSKFIQTVEYRDEQMAQFFHRFPVDITIPLHRVKSIEDIDVLVDSFDYAFPERTCLKLTADLTITGLRSEETAVPTETEIKEENVPQPFDFVRSGQELEEPSEEPTAVEVKSFKEPSTNDLFAPFTAEARIEPLEEDESTPAPSEAAPILVRSFEKQAEPEIQFSVNRFEEPKEANNEVLDEVEEVIELPEEQPVPEEPVLEEEVQEAPEEKVKKKKKKSKKQGISITEFLARKEEKDEVARLRVCIVQQGDTVETIADRYDVSILQLLKVNQLEVNQDIHEGQVLYIPDTVSHHS